MGKHFRLSSINFKKLNENKKFKISKLESTKFVKLLVAIVGVVAIGTSVIIGGTSYAKKKIIVPKIPYTIKDCLNINSKGTFLDDILIQEQVEDGQITLLEKVSQLEFYIDMSTKIEQLDLSSYTDTAASVEDSDFLNRNLEEMYQEFLILRKSTDINVLSEESLRLCELAVKLNGYKVFIDNKIISDGYDIFAEYGILVAKTAILDSASISYTNIDNLEIPSEHTKYVFTVEYEEPTTGKVFITKIPMTSIIYKVIDNVYKAQSKDTTNINIEEAVNELSGYLNDAKVASFMRHENDGTLNPVNNYDDVRAIIKK